MVEPLQLPSQSLAPADNRHLGQEAEVFVQDGTVGALEELHEAARQEVECVDRGQLREEFLLLGLVVQDFRLWVAE